MLALRQGPLPLETVQLGDQAMKCRAFAKALHYKEEEFHRGPNTQILESLIRSVAPLAETGGGVGWGSGSAS